MYQNPTDIEFLFYTKFRIHSHIIHSFGFVGNDLQSLLLLQEHAPYDNLLSLLEHKRFQPSVGVLVQIFLQIVDAMVYITDERYVHGDLRCKNVLVFQMNESEPGKSFIKLTNFTCVHRNDPSCTKQR